MSIESKYSLSLLTLVALFLPAPANAQSGEQDDERADSNIIIVTAQKREENIQEVPIAISAIGRDYLDSRDITSIDNLGALAPNVKFERAPSNKTISQIAIRGSVTINPAVTWEPAVGLYLDGVYIAKAQGSIFDVADLERVEILRGPQGTLYGRNSLAGAVNLVTRKPSGELRVSAEASYGNYDYWRGKSTVDLPALGPLKIKVSGQIEKRDGFVDVVPDAFGILANPLVNDTNDLDGKSVMVQARLDLSDNLTLDYAYDYTKYNQRPNASQLLSVNTTGGPADIFDPASPSFVGVPLGLFANQQRLGEMTVDGSPLFETSRTYGHSLTATLDLGNAQLKSITAYRDLRWTDSTDLDGSPFDIAFTQRFTDMDSFSQELQLTGTALDDRLNYVVGGFYYDESAGTVNPQTFFGLFGPFGNQFDSRYSSNTEAWAVYAQADIKITDALKLTLGGRYTEETKDISRFLQVIRDPTIPAVALPLTVANIQTGDLPDAKFNNFSPAATLSYQINPDLNAYARFAKGFKSGGFNGETNQFGPPTAGCPTGTPELCTPYRPEKVDSYELGLKSIIADSMMTLNIAGFYDKHEDIQLSVFDASGAASSTVLNAAQATIWGIEIETVVRPADWLTINGSFAYLNSSYDSFIELNPATGLLEDVSDDRAFPHTPEFTAALGVDWTVVEGDWGKFNLIGDINMVSKYHTFPYSFGRVVGAGGQLADTTESPGRVMVNMSAILSDFDLGGAKGKVSAWVRNLTNEDAPSNFIDFGPAFGGLLLGYFPDPRTYGLTVGVEF
ncbi:TonB-dependent receptor [Parasphingorhabdus halotolerans]|uniref:TonB-dependent receptor n=1 Tax=Parasphingorhabdus halotolerans TaxID=2725558 RepID=A0A6H2DLG5_9SPHN|nr:TonB-dependent receptor [Parasphingorhabdus halotolerans]QJB68795.1 TonB-dependent receptor [Parasphingorhabdus halotolerans]